MMNNNDIPNYAYLAGSLQSLAESLAYDTKFSSLRSPEKRLAYVKAEVEAARRAAIEHANKYGN
jgi:hypothetical protein